MRVSNGQLSLQVLARHTALHALLSTTIQLSIDIVNEEMCVATYFELGTKGAWWCLRVQASGIHEVVSYYSLCGWWLCIRVIALCVYELESTRDYSVLSRVCRVLSLMNENCWERGRKGERGMNVCVRE